MKRERLEDLGYLCRMLNEIVEMDVFDNISKHDSYWCDVSPTDLETKYGKVTREEVLVDRLDECRMRFALIYDRISECLDIAKGDDEE